MGKEDTPPEEIYSTLCEIVNDIWRNSLTKDHFTKLVEIFIRNDDLSLTHRKLILECMIPKFVVDDETVENLLIWFLSTYINESQSSAIFLAWLASLMEHKLVEFSTLEMFYDQLANCFQADCLVKPLCNVLEPLTNERTVNLRVASLIQQFYREFNNTELKHLLWKIKKYRPHYVDVEFKSQPVKRIKKTDFDKALIKAARKQGLEYPVNNLKSEKLIIGTLPEPEYLVDKALRPKKLTNITSARELGISIYNLNVIFPQNPVSLIGSKPGMMYLELFGPSEEFLQSLQGSIEAQPSELILSKLSELQNRLRHGLPIISKYLAGYLITWDGLESRQMVFDLIKWAHFDTFADLCSSILLPLSRLYICSNVDTKVRILHAFENLVINMVSVHMERLQQEQNKLETIFGRPKWLGEPLDTFTKFCSHVQSLIMTGLMMEGLDSTSLILQAVSFYNTIITLQVEFSLICLIVPLPPLVRAGLVSMNHIVLSEIALLILRYKKDVIPLLESLGEVDLFSIEIDLLNEMSEIMMDYLWSREDLSKVESHSLISKSNIRENVKSHPGVFPLIEFLCSKLKVNPNKINKKDLLLILINYSPGIGEFINYYLKGNNMQDNLILEV
ncbi:centromere protein I-like isoform X2 [Rhodnius prolixus]|uniref:centromere protein I-like isoform X2 n=1 Tax=Rhodnius prolixus TaxID=13249 RepID=UPI003D18908F